VEPLRGGALWKEVRSLGLAGRGYWDLSPSSFHLSGLHEVSSSDLLTVGPLLQYSASLQAQNIGPTNMG
jgi:hypothetical protein